MILGSNPVSREGHRRKLWTQWINRFFKDVRLLLILTFSLAPHKSLLLSHIFSPPLYWKGVHVSHRQLRGHKGNEHLVLLLFYVKSHDINSSAHQHRDEGSGTEDKYHETTPKPISRESSALLKVQLGSPEEHSGRQKSKLRTPKKGHPVWLPPGAVPGKP